jgi:hypothetical protein
MISRSNYEIYFVDFFDNRLGEEAKRELFAFLEINPDLKAEFEEFENISTKPQLNIVFRNKESLKKNTPTLLNYKTWLVAELENDLSKEDISMLDEFIRKNPSIEEERMKMQEIKLTADKIVFANKKELRKPVVVPFRIVSVRTISIAAAVAIFVLGFLFIYRSHEPERIFVDEKKGKSIKEDKPTIAESPARNVNENKINPENSQAPVIVEENKRTQDKQHSASPNPKKKIHNDSKTAGPLFTDNKKKNISSPDKDTLKNIQPVIVPGKTDAPVAFEQKKDKVVHPKSKPIELADIFDESEIKELQNNSAPKEAAPQNFALKEVERISGVSVKKKQTEESTTYAFSVKRVFSIEHSSANR